MASVTCGRCRPGLPGQEGSAITPDEAERKRLREAAPDPWLTREEAAEYAHVSVNTIDRWREAGALQSTKTSQNGRVRIRRSWVDAALLRFMDHGPVLIWIAVLGLTIGATCGGHCPAFLHHLIGPHGRFD